jgi:hypothetical protein
VRGAAATARQEEGRQLPAWEATQHVIFSTLNYYLNLLSRINLF